MSLRDRFVRAPAPSTDPSAETRAAQALVRQRGRASYAGAPRAGKAAAAVLKPLLPQSGMGLGELKRRWSEIVGDSLARATPEKLAAGVLVLRAPGALAPFLQQQTPLLIERLRLAGASVKSVRIEQRAAPVRPSNVQRPKAALTPVEEAALERRFDPVADPGLKSALLRLGRAVKQG
jgi:hypothetical protein